jgi:VWFA-related protein
MPTREPHFSVRSGGAVLALCMSAVGLVGAAVTGQQPTFRSTVELIAVDVQVVGDDGTPVDRLEPGAFEVSIEGHRRKVVSAQFVRQAAAVPSPEKLASTPTPPAPADGRTFVIAVDNGSFNVGTTKDAMEALRGFMGHLDPVDRVGLYVFPTGGWIAPTIQRAPLRAALDHVYGERQTLLSRYNLSPWEIVDISAESSSPNSVLTSLASRAANAQAAAIAEPLSPILRIQRRECPEDAQCPKRIYAEGMELGVQLEHQTQSSLNGLEILLRELSTIPGRKYVVLVSAGLLVSDRLDGRPDVGDVARAMGQSAAQAHATLYTVQVDLNSANPAAASKRSSISSELSRDRAMFGNWLDNFSRAAGGMRIYVPVGGGGFAFDRVLRESSAYYLLGVEPAEADRDGKPRQLHVKVDRRGTIVRSRQWVLVPPRSRS